MGQLVPVYSTALVLLREREKKDDDDGGGGGGGGAGWAPYMTQLPGAYDLLGTWTDAQLAQLQCPGLIKQAWAQRVENIKAAEAVEALAGDGGWLRSLSAADIAWGLNTVRSRSFLGKYPEGAALPPLQGMTLLEQERGKDADAGADAVVEGGAGGDVSGAAAKSETKEDPSTFVLPFLDAFNHAGGAATQLRYNKAAASFELTSSRNLAPGEEATISYGKHGNDELLLRFGFCIEGNRDETVPLLGCMAELDWLIAGTDRR
jgi:hypothetical protein